MTFIFCNIRYPDLSLLSHIADKFKCWSKVGGTIEIHILQSTLIGWSDTLKSIDFRIENVSVKGEAVRGSVDCRWNCCTVPKYWNMLFRIIILKNFTNWLNGVKVLVFVHIKIVKRVSVRWVPIAESEVDCDVKLDFTSAKNVFEESVSLVELECLEINCLIFALI